eukprot:GHVU01021826.1.p1 GENE.GHVU01021826.1~~GHVU01021826.1.p1  ORF type:complete len:123 (+),score=10.75 GHVU01021826.1:145-513(+)
MEPTKPYEVLYYVKLDSKHTDPEFYETAWLETFKYFPHTFARQYPAFYVGPGRASKLRLWKEGGMETWNDSGLSLYMIAGVGDKRNWYSLSDPSESKPKPTQEELESMPEFLVTGHEGTWPG